MTFILVSFTNRGCYTVFSNHIYLYWFLWHHTSFCPNYAVWKKNTFINYFNIPSFRPSVLPDSVSAHYLRHTWRFSNEIWYIGLSGEYAVWVWIWVRSNNFQQSYALGLRKIPLIFSFRSLSPLQIDIFNWNVVYRSVRRIRRLSSNLRPV